MYSVTFCSTENKVLIDWLIDWLSYNPTPNYEFCRCFGFIITPSVLQPLPLQPSQVDDAEQRRISCNTRLQNVRHLNCFHSLLNLTAHVNLFWLYIMCYCQRTAVLYLFAYQCSDVLELSRCVQENDIVGIMNSAWQWPKPLCSCSMQTYVWLLELFCIFFFKFSLILSDILIKTFVRMCVWQLQQTI